MEPPTSLARRWNNGLVWGGGRCPWVPAKGTPPWNRHPRWRVGGATALDGAAVVAAAVGLAVAGMRWGAKIRRMGWLTRHRGLSPGPRQGDAPLATAHLADTVVGQRPETVRRFRP